jgi:pimeloyl-ACP methyl ester carboxylesterase
MAADRLTRRVRLSTGITIPYLEQGDPTRTPVLLLHAWVESARCFDRLLAALPSTMHVLAMDVHQGPNSRRSARARAHLGAAFTGLTTALPPSESGTITVPTLIIWGERDELLPRQDEEMLAAAIPDSRLVIYENTGHVVL